MKAIDRALALSAPPFCVLILADLVDGVLRSVARWNWNDVRLARSVALWHGYPLYPAREINGPIIGTMHGPLPHLLYSCLAFLKDPTHLLIAGCALSCLLYFGAVLWLHIGAGRSIAGLYGFFACAALLLANQGTRYHGLTVHVDALAMCCAMLAAGLLLRVESRMLTASAILAMLAVASKQTVAPVAIALPLFVLIVDGKRAFFKYLSVQIAATVAIFAAMLALFRPARALLFNTFTLGARLPRTPEALSRMMGGLYQLRGELVPAAAPLCLLLAIVALSGGNIRGKIGRHRWLVFLWVAMFQLPIELRAWSTAGGGTNHLGVVVLFVTLAATLGLASLCQPDASPKQEWIGFAARALLIGVLLAKVPVRFEISRDWARAQKNPTRIAFDYERRHPGRAYFPNNPLAVLLANGTLTHFDHALLDRQLAGFPVSAGQFAAGLPPDYQLVAYPPKTAPESAITRGLVAGKPLVEEPELKGWRVYRLSAAPTQPTLESRP